MEKKNNAKKTVKIKDPITTLLSVGNGVVSFCAAALATVLIQYSGYVLYDKIST